MLNTEIKKIIDSARNILVGKLPAPNIQVEQITLAMLYKFMYDLDQESVNLGGKEIYFSDEFSKYSWINLISKTISSQERMSLYIEAIDKFYYNLNLPKTFRDIFKNASVPYRDPEVLTLFLKEIDKLNYGDSEKMGDTYEYLLSILGSQGELGQFRTPRHIIDFIVEIIKPKINEKILDPACGTAGFLISAFKYIINDINNKNLNYSQKTKILDNINGYDIEPSMVKIAEMNMYLHGCSEPKINEYDTLTSEEKWDDTYDIILANPPFMSPTGGIKPHNKFQVQANRAEVLFVDYILEHLKFDGRAGIIVPDSILYNETSNAYIELRKLLVVNNLVAVISLPAGIFKPYAKDIKTSILIIDKKVASKSKEIILISVKNDGYSLSDTRKPINKNDLSTALKVINNYLDSLNNNIKFSKDNVELDYYLFPKKELENNNYVLLQSKYENQSEIISKYPIFKLSDLIIESKERVGISKNVKSLSVSNKLGFTSSDELFNDSIHSSNLSNYKIIRRDYFAYNPSRINVGSIALKNDEELGCVSPMYIVFKISNKDKLHAEYLFYILKSEIFKIEIEQSSFGAVRKQLKFNSLKNLKIPVPSIEEQTMIINNIKLQNEKINMLNVEIDKIKSESEFYFSNIWKKKKNV